MQIADPCVGRALRSCLPSANFYIKFIGYLDGRFTLSTGKQMVESEPEAFLSAQLLEVLNASGIHASRVSVDPDHLKGGYICDTCRVQIHFADGTPARSAVLKQASELVMKKYGTCNPVS